MKLLIGIAEFICIAGIAAGAVGLIAGIIKHKKKWPWLVMIAVCFLITGVCASCTEKTEDPEQTEETAAVPETEIAVQVETTAEPEITAEHETEPETTAVPETTELDMEGKTQVEQVEALAEKLFDFEYESLEVKEGIGLIILSYRPTCLYNDNSGWVRQNMNRYINFCREAYKIEGMEPIRFNVLGLGMDQYGEEGEFKGLDILMMPEDFSCYKWDNLDWQPYSEQLLEDFRVLQIHELFQEEFQPDEVIYEATGPDGMIR